MLGFVKPAGRERRRSGVRSGVVGRPQEQLRGDERDKLEWRNADVGLNVGLQTRRRRKPLILNSLHENVAERGDSNPRAGYPARRFRGAPVTTTSVPLRWGLQVVRLSRKNSCIRERLSSSRTPPRPPSGDSGPDIRAPALPILSRRRAAPARRRRPARYARESWRRAHLARLNRDVELGAGQAIVAERRCRSPLIATISACAVGSCELMG